jgi:hypothetical protein
MKNVPNCSNCWDKGYSTHYEGASYAMPDFIGDKKYKVSDEGIRIIFCRCKRGQFLKRNPKKIIL